MKFITKSIKLCFLIVFLISFFACSAKQHNLSSTLTNAVQESGSVESAVLTAVQKISKNKSLNAFIHVDKRAAVKAAKEADIRRQNGKSKGILDGVLLVVKDNIHVAGMPNTAGTPALKGFIPTHDAPVIQRLKKAGAIILGKTNMHELAFGISSYNTAFYENHIGVRNSHDIERMAGGSSGGTAAAIGAGIVYGGLGTDTGGSARIPSALNGVVGFRPTIGRYSQEGVTPISHTRDTIGPIAVDVKSVAMLDSVITGEKFIALPAKEENLRIGVSKEFLKNVEPEIKLLWDKTITAFEKAEITVVEIDASEIMKLNALIGFPVALYEAGTDMRSYLKKYDTGINIEQLAAKISSPDVFATYNDLVVPGKLPGPDGLLEAAPIYDAAIKTHRPMLIQAYNNIFKNYKIDALAFPTTPAVAKRADKNSSSLENFILFIQNTDPGSNAGLPGLSIPMGLATDNLPAGIEIDGPAGSDSKLLSIGLALEKIIRK